MKSKVTLILFLFISINAFSQVVNDTIRGEVGEEVIINIVLSDSIIVNDNNIISGKIFISNPTVFYPDTLRIESGFNITKNELLRQNDSLWYFTMEFKKSTDNSKNIKIELIGEALAGSDSLSNIKFTGIKINDLLINEINKILITHTSGTPLPYIRFARLDQNFPNPVPGGSSTKWHYIIDKPSLVEFYIIDYRGKETYLINLGEQPIGIHEYVFTPDMGFSSGLYWMKLKTNSGETLIPFIIIK